MTYPQPSSDSAVVNGQKYFRLLTQMASPGDIYESAQSGYAFVVGPESDLAHYNISYFDGDIAGLQNNILISNRASFAGLIQSHNETQYADGNPARILFSPADIVPALTNTAALQIIPPTFDVIQYFTNPPATLPAQRNDKFYYFQNYPAPGGITAYTVLLPYYGRVYGTFDFGSAPSEKVRIRGINYGIGGSLQPREIVASTALGVNGLRKIITSDVDGMFDYIEIQIDPNGGTGLNIPTFIRFSDVPQS